jgi:hypothetical protein
VTGNHGGGNPHSGYVWTVTNNRLKKHLYYATISGNYFSTSYSDSFIRIDNLFNIQETVILSWLWTIQEIYKKTGFYCIISLFCSFSISGNLFSKVPI